MSLVIAFLLAVAILGVLYLRVAYKLLRMQQYELLERYKGHMQVDEHALARSHGTLMLVLGLCLLACPLFVLAFRIPLQAGIGLVVAINSVFFIGERIIARRFKATVR